VVSVTDPFCQIKEDGMDKAFSTHREKRDACRILVAKRERKRPLGTRKRRWG
jgi:hypothetical protein